MAFKRVFQVVFLGNDVSVIFGTRALKFGFGRPRPVATGAERIAPRIARPAGRRAAMERGVSSVEGVGTVNGGSAVDDERDEMQFSGTSRSTRRTRDD